MGWIKDAKASALAKEASRAVEEGRSVFVTRINVGVTHHGMSGSVPDMAEQIEAVESAGWHLDQMSWTQDEKNRPEGYFLFRRR